MRKTLLRALERYRKAKAEFDALDRSSIDVRVTWAENRVIDAAFLVA